MIRKLIEAFEAIDWSANKDRVIKKRRRGCSRKEEEEVGDKKQSIDLSFKRAHWRNRNDEQLRAFEAIDWGYKTLIMPIHAVRQVGPDIKPSD